MGCWYGPIHAINAAARPRPQWRRAAPQQHGRAVSVRLDAQGVLTQTAKAVGNKHEVEKSHEHRIELLESREDAPVAFETPEQALHLVTTLAHCTVVFPWIQPFP